MSVSSNISWIFLVFSALALPKGDRIFSFNEEIDATGDDLAGDSAMGPEKIKDDLTMRDNTVKPVLSGHPRDPSLVSGF